MAGVVQLHDRPLERSLHVRVLGSADTIGLAAIAAADGKADTAAQRIRLGHTAIHIISTAAAASR